MKNPQLQKAAEQLASLPKTLANKDEFHRIAREVLRLVRKEIGGSGSLRSCRGGPGVLGEAILHADRVYVQMYGDRIMFRSCQGQTDYTGGRNQWYSYEDLAKDPGQFIKYTKNPASTGAIGSAP